MHVAFDVVSWYGLLAAIVAAVLLWLGAARELLNGFRWIKNKVAPPPPTPLPNPVVVMGAAGGQVSVEFDEEGKRRLVRAEPAT